MPPHMRDAIKERGRELARNIWVRALPEDLDDLQARIDSLGENRDLLFETLADPMIHQVEVTETEIQFELGPFYYVGIRDALERALSIGARLASQLDADVA